ncbi:MAG: DnaD domain protein, partial [Oscillospiraceae bacterium]
TPVSVSSGEIASRILEDTNIKTLFEEAEKLYAHPLRQRDNQTIIALVDHYGLSVGVSLMLLQYCKKVDKLTPSYISTVASDWAENGILTIEKADERIRSLEKQNGIEERLREALDMKTDFPPAQKKYIRVWTEDWGFSEEIILLAINKTIEQIGQPKLNYTNKILENWKADGITTPEQTEKPASAPKPADTNSSFDKNDVMANILKRYKG